MARLQSRCSSLSLLFISFTQDSCLFIFFLCIFRSLLLAFNEQGHKAIKQLKFLETLAN